MNDPTLDYRPELLDPSADRDRLAALRNDPSVVVLDRLDAQLGCLGRLCPRPAADVLDEPPVWAYYPWRRTLVALLGPRGFAALRLDRNRNLITVDEQRRLAGRRVAVAGLSVGHVIAHTLALQGLCGALRVADFDTMELSNLNRVPATVFDLGVNKAIVAARRIAELDPYLEVDVITDGVTTETLAAFLDGVDVVVEECDSLDVKALLREAARDRRVPVVMATSDRGLIDVERFDAEPGRPVLHGLLGDLDADAVATLSDREKIPLLLHLLDASELSPRFTASLIEVGHTLSTWPQLAGDVTLGAVIVAEAVRRIGLGEPMASGQTRIDVPAALATITDPAARATARDPGSPGDGPPAPTRATPPPADSPRPGRDEVVELVAAAANRAPSGGNVQPWLIDGTADRICIRVDPSRTSGMDAGFRGSALAVGAAAFNARVAAARWDVLGPVTFTEDDAGAPLTAEITLRDGGTDAWLRGLYEPMLDRESNRRLGTADPLPEHVAADLRDATGREGGELRLLDGDALRRAAEILAAAERMRYLTPRLHTEMISELRWPGDGDPDSGLDVRSLELSSDDMALLDVVRRPDVMAHLADWNAGAALGLDSLTRMSSAAALAVVTVRGSGLADFARGGGAVEAFWITAQRRGLGVQPMSPVFLLAVTDADSWEQSPRFGAELAELRTEFRTLAGLDADESLVLTMRLAHAEPASVRSRRRPLDTERPAPDRRI